MRTVVAIKSGSLTNGSRLTLTSRNDKDHTCQLAGVTIEDPGWPVGTEVVVVEYVHHVVGLQEGRATLERWDEKSWRQEPGTPGLKGAVARWVKRHAGGDMTEGVRDMVGAIYEGVVVSTDAVAAGPNSDKQVSRIIFKHGPFVAKNEQTASGIVLAEALKDRVSDGSKPFDANDVEVIVRPWK